MQIFSRHVFSVWYLQTAVTASGNTAVMAALPCQWVAMMGYYYVDPGFSSVVTGVVEIPLPLWPGGCFLCVEPWMELICLGLTLGLWSMIYTGGGSSKCLLTAGWLLLAWTKANRLAVWVEHTQPLLKEKHKVAVSEGWEPRANSTPRFLTKESVVRYTG